jgi:zinc transporter ZupT
MNAILLSFVTFISTLLGGWFGIKNRKHLHLIISFTAGVILGVVFFDIVPEMFEMVRENGLSATSGMMAIVVGFLAIHTLEKSAIIRHEHHEEGYAEHHHHHPSVGVIGALGLAFHSFLDGVGIGLGFHISPQVGAMIALAVIAHDFSDGLNTVGLMLINRNTERRTFGLLIIDALAPVLGALTTFLFTIPNSLVVIYLGFFAGFLLYLGASDLLPEAHRAKSSYGLIALTAAGALLMFLVTRAV